MTPNQSPSGRESPRYPGRGARKLATDKSGQTCQRLAVEAFPNESIPSKPAKGRVDWRGWFVGPSLPKPEKRDIELLAIVLGQGIAKCQ
ncbi:hypothetical protein BMS96_06095 [Leuconostoc lactis]|nr:hypothetical protein BMS96_06095 [Leuconostoc lactis]